MNPHSSDEDDDAPEAVSLSQSKKLIQQQNSSIRQFQNAQKEKKRAKNRERDRKLKEQAQGRKKGRGKDEESSGDEGDDDAIARMRRAMKEAGEESDEDMDAEMYDEEDEEEESDEEEEEFHGFDAPRKSNYLPDHLFASAAASVPSVEKKTKSKSSKEAEKTRKRKRSTAKDRVLGSCIIRALPDPNKPPSGTPSMVPTTKIRKFLDRNLSLRKTDKRVGGWERRSANIGSMKIDHGPAAHFVRQLS
ncbi:hypothetical protein ARMSODRAFT_960678 [Armillaria solidipes]|uniref:Uncharacterized protein n=1 Tax=Armillaria solidipes TaxID=1076256 RepID=A0A2H3BFH5_9AGAR|nr:hypothetical protein ARMSODRAFT_960678 [Armillaria solidipes]